MSSTETSQPDLEPEEPPEAGKDAPAKAQQGAEPFHQGAFADQPDDDQLDFREAAIIAEFETGEREPTARKAWHHALLRIARMSFGGAVVITGIIMLPLPGPGLLVISIGLAILARDVAWADRLLQKVLERLPSNEHGKLPRSTIVTMVLLGLAGITFSVAYAVGDWSLFFWRS